MNRFIVWIKRVMFLLLLLGLLQLITNIFGVDSAITNFVKDKIVFTPYNIVGMIMVCAAPLGIWFGKKGGSKLFSAISSIALFISIISILASVTSWFVDINIENFIGKIKNYSIGILSIAIFVVLIICIFALIKAFKSSKSTYKNDFNNIYENDIEFKLYNQKSEINSFEHQSTNQIESEETDNQQHANFNIEENPYISDKVDDVNKKCEDDYEYKITHKICPVCGGRLKARQNHETCKWFMGCENYFTQTNCDFTIDYPTYKNYQSNIVKLYKD